MEISMENSSNKKDESTYVFDKSMNCPVCDSDFKTKQVKTGKARFLGTEADLRPLYSGIDTIKYDVCLCPKCGYASTLREFNNVTPKQRALLKEMIGSKYTAMEDSADYYTYDIAIKRYKMALLTAMTKPARGSEQAYLCLKLAWLYRGAAEELQQDDTANLGQIAKYNKLEAEYIEKAYKGFTEALLKEYPPICNMDEVTINSLLAQLAHKCNDDDTAQKFAYMVMGSRNASSKAKDKARELMEVIRESRHETTNE